MLLTCVIMEFATASVVHFVNSSYPLPADEVLCFRQVMHSFFARYGFARNSKSEYFKTVQFDRCALYLMECIYHIFSKYLVLEMKNVVFQSKYLVF